MSPTDITANWKDAQQLGKMTELDVEEVSRCAQMCSDVLEHILATEDAGEV